MVAPVIPYGFTGVMDAYPGSFTIPEDAFRNYVRASYFTKVNDKIARLIQETIKKWDIAGV
jgi:creatinine amidohydrolase/Fe(II)-dependent formamide hydrolase-like protein